jgi:phosphate-selective porin OprO and OprP
VRIAATVAVLAVLTAAAVPSFAAAPSDELDQRLKVIERKLELDAEEAQAKARETAGVTAGEKGFGLKDAEGAFEFRLRGLLQADGRFFVADPAAQGFNDTFAFRRIEPVFELTLARFVLLKLQPQFAGDAATVADAYGELRFAPAFGVRVGKFKAPVGLENLQSSSAIAFNERGFPTELGPNRDIGVQLQGELFAGTTGYALGVFNGAADGRDGAASDTDSRKELAARLFFEPFRNDYGVLRGLGFGIGASSGDKLNAIGATTTAATATANYNNSLPRYRSPGQNTIFSYRIATATAPTTADTVVAAGIHTRHAPQLYFYRNCVGVLGEYILSKQDVAIGGTANRLSHRAWQGVATWVLTGEDAGYRGIARPARPYTPGAPGWGALEIAARYGELLIDEDAFPVYADPARSVRRAQDAGVGLNWSLTANARVSVDYDETRYEGGAAGGDRDREQAIVSRLQISY